MSSKTWRLVVTGLGGSAPLHEITVEAENWLTALRLGRKQLGEEGGVPTGSSCAVAPSGKVTIMDPMARRQYLLTPDTSESLAPPPQSTPKIPADAAPQPARVSQATVAYISPAELPRVEVRVGAAAPPAAPPPPDPPPVERPSGPPRPRAKPALKATIGYATTDAAVQVDVDVAAPELEPQPEPVAPPPPPAPVAPPAVVAPPAPPPPVAAPAPPVAPPAPAALPAPPAVVAPAAPPAPAPPPSPLDQAAASAGLALLSQRDEEPTAASPLLYRERTFVVNAGTSPDLAEQLLRGQLTELQRELASRPAGKFLNIAIFDHRWEGRPLRPPIVALQWKDWKGAPEVSRPAARASAPAAPLGRPPAMSGPPAQVAPSGRVATPLPFPAQGGGAPTPARPPSVRPPPGMRPPTGRQRISTGEQDERLANVFEALQDLFFLSTPAEGLEFVARLVHETIPCEAISACLYDINTDEFRFVVLDGPGSEVLRGEALPASVGLFGVCAHRVGEALLVEDIAHDSRFDAGVDGRLGIDPKNAMYMALHHEGRLLGALQLLNRTGHAQFSRSDANVIAYVGTQLAEFLHAARIAPDRPSSSRKR